MADPTNEAKNPVKSTRTTFRIVETLVELDGAGVTGIAERLDLSKSSVHNYLSTMHEDGYVVKDGATYHVGLRFLNLGGRARHRYEVYEVGKPEIRTLAEETEELANLLVEEHGRGVYLHREAGAQSVKVDSYTGHRVHLHNTALGKAILAFTPDDHVEAILDRHGMPATTEQTITRADELFDELEVVRERGVAFDRGERLEGLRCAAAPIIVNSDRVVGAVSVSGPARRMSGDRFEVELPERIQDVVNVIELNISYA